MVALGLMSEEEAKVANKNAWKKNNEADQQCRQIKKDGINSNSNKGLRSQTPTSQKQRKVSSRKEGHHKEDFTRRNGVVRHKGVSTRNRSIEMASQTSRKTNVSVEGSRKSSRKRGRKPYEAEGIWI